MSNRRNADFLSSLPDDILIKILGLTESYKCAVQCSVLSKRWKALYKNLSCLYFNEVDLFKRVEDDKCGDEHIAMRALVAYHNGAIAMSRHTGRLHTLHFFFHFWDSGDKWKCLLRHLWNNHTIRHLTWGFHEAGNLSDCVFSCTSLVTLDLISVDISSPIPDDFQGFPNLRKLRLLSSDDFNVRVFKWVQELLSRCPLLEKLTLYLNLKDLREEEYDEPLILSCPNLLFLDLSFDRIESPFQVRIVAPHLSKMHLACNFSSDCEDKDINIMVEAPKLVGISNPGNEYVTLAFHPFELPKLFERIAYARFQSFPNLIKCKINLFNPISSDRMNEWLDDLLSKCPNLQHLSLMLHFDKELHQEEEEVNHEQVRHGDKEVNNCEEDDFGWNLICSSQSLLGLGIWLKDLRCKLHITAEAPQLLKMDLKYKHSVQAYKIHVEVEAPKLLELSIPDYKHVLLDLYGHEFSKKVEGVVNAKWDTTDHSLTELELNGNFEGSSKGNIYRHLFDMSWMFWNLKHLALSEIQAHPKDLWNQMLINLPLLETLTFTNCDFQKTILSLNNWVSECNMLKLKEIKFTDKACYSLDGEREMICILLQNTPNLQMLRFALKQKKREFKDEYIALLATLLSPGSGPSVCLSFQSYMDTPSMYWGHWQAFPCWKLYC